METKSISLKDFNWARFNVEYRECMHHFFYSYDDVPFDKDAYHYPVEGFKIKKEWDENGCFINLFLDSEDKNCMDVLDLYYQEMKLRLPDYSIERIMEDDKIVSVSTKIFDIPFSEFALKSKNGESLVEEFHAHEFGFTNLLSDISPDSKREDWESFYFIEHV